VVQPGIPNPVIRPVEPMNPGLDYAPQWDHDTDTLASFITYQLKAEGHNITKQTCDTLLTPICHFVRETIKYQMATHAVTVKIPDLEEMKERELETQKHILHLTETITELAKQVATLSARPIPTTTPTIIKTVVAPPQQYRKPPAPTKLPMSNSTLTYAQVVEDKTKEFTEVRSKKKVKKETVLPQPYPTADRLLIFNLTSAPNDRKEAADRALQLINKTITTHNDITHPPFILAKITNSNNLVFTVAHQHLGKN
jgi:hypothetical protein